MTQGSATPESPERVRASGMFALTPDQREKIASKLVERFAIWSSVAGLIPLPGVDVATVGGLQVQMVRRISQIYGVPFSNNWGKALIASWAGSTIPATSAVGTASALMFVPILGVLASEFVMPVLSAGATYAIGKAFIQHFASGGTMLDFNSPDYRGFIKVKRKYGIHDCAIVPSKAVCIENAIHIDEARAIPGSLHDAGADVA